MDAFYASVEQREHPELLGRPVAVGGKPQVRGVIAAASYEARKFGVRSAMPSRTATKLCPELVLLPMRMPLYAETSRQIGEIFARYTPAVEPLSLDEAFLDVAGSTRLFGDVPTIGRRIKEDIYHELQLTASIGIAPNKFVAKLASDLQKPDGFVTVYPPLTPFLDPLPIQRLWGIGPTAAKKLNSIGIHTIYDFRQTAVGVLKKHLGHTAEQLLKLAHGEDDRSVEPQRETVSISKETTFEADVQQIDHLAHTLLMLTEQVAEQLRRKNLAARTIGIKLRHANFKTISRSRTLPRATNTTRVIWDLAQTLLVAALDQEFNIRLIGIQVSSLSDSATDQQHAMTFDKPDRQRKIDEVMDEMNQKFGSGTLHRGLKHS